AGRSWPLTKRPCGRVTPCGKGWPQAVLVTYTRSVTVAPSCRSSRGALQSSASIRGCSWEATELAPVRSAATLEDVGLSAVHEPVPNDQQVGVLDRMFTMAVNSSRICPASTAPPMLAPQIGRAHV